MYVLCRKLSSSSLISSSPFIFAFFSSFFSSQRRPSTFDDHHHLIQSIKDIFLLMPSSSPSVMRCHFLHHCCHTFRSPARTISFGFFPVPKAYAAGPIYNYGFCRLREISFKFFVLFLLLDAISIKFIVFFLMVPEFGAA